MSTTVEERVVSMQFDNKQFENNVSTTMSTLDKLKQKLNLSGASKGLEDVQTAAKKVDMNPLANSVEAVRVKFSALQVMGVTALQNITNQAVNAGKRIVSSLTTAPVGDGFKEYEMTLNAVQTTMAGTGKTAAEVEKELKRLDEYADKTVYSTADMLNNLPKFTNADVELEKATTAMIGIANATAHAGGDASKASIAFYNLGQAIGTGYLTRMDYNSINNAGIATMEWKEQMIEAAIAQGTLTKTGEDAYKAGNKTYSLQQLFIDGLQEQWATTDVMMKVFGDYGDETTEIGKKAQSSAQDIKTFTQMMESLKATAGTGWKDTWQIIFGGLYEAKEFWTGISEFISGILNAMSDWRNGILESALGKGFGKLADKINGILKPVKKTAETVETVTKSAKEYSKVVDEIMSGDWGTGQTRWDKLTEAGYDWAHAQNLVNEKLGDSTRHTTNYTEAQKGLEKAQKKTAESQAKTIADLVKMDDAQLKSIGYTDEQIKSLRELEKQADKVGLSVSEFVDNIDKIDGRWLLINTFKNAASALGKVFETLKGAWQDIFPPKTMDEHAAQLYNIIAALHKFSTTLTMSDETAGKLRRTFKGLFALIDIITTITGGAFKIAFKVVSSILGAFDLDILDVTASIGDMLVGFRDFIDSALDVGKIFSFIVPFIKKAGDSISDWFDGLKEADNVPEYIITGLVNGLKKGVSLVASAISEIGKTILTTIKNVLGIHSPSTEFFDIGKNVIVGLLNGLKEGVTGVWEFIKGIGTTCIDILSKIDFGKIFAMALGVGMLVTIKKVADTLSAFTAPLEGIGEAFEGLGQSFKASATKKKSQAMLNMALAIAVLSASLIALTYIKPGKLWNAVAVILVLSGVLVALAIATDKMSKASTDISKNGVKINNMTSGLLSIGVALLLLAITVKMLGNLDPEAAKQGFLGLAGVMIALLVVMKVCGTLTKGGGSEHIDKVGTMLRKLALSFLAMILVIKLASKLEGDELLRGIAVVGLLGVLFAALTYVSKFAGEHASKAGSMILKMSFAFLVMIGVIKLASKLDDKELITGLKAIVALGVLFTALMVVSRIAGNNGGNVGSAIFKMSLAFMVAIGAIKLASSMDPGEIKKGLAAITALSVLFGALIVVSKFAGKHASEAGSMLLKISAALLILTGIAFILSQIDTKDLVKGITAIYALGLFVAGLIAVTKFSKSSKSLNKTLIILIVAITLLAVAITALSFIDSASLKAASTALSSVMATFALLMYVTKFTKNTKSMRQSLLMMLGVVAVLGLIIAALSFTNPTSAIASATSISILLTAFASSLAILGTAGRISTTVTKQIAPMLMVTAGLAAILGILGALEVEASIQSAIAIGILLNAMSSAMLILSYTGPLALSGVGALALMGLVVGELAIILGLMAAFNIQPSMATVASLSVLLIAMSGALVILGVVGAMGPAAFIGIAALATLIAGIGGLIVAIGALMTEFPALEEFLNAGIPILEKIGFAIGSFFGNIISGFADGVLDIIPTFGTKLSEFMTNLKPFIDGATSIDPSSMDGAKALAEMIVLLTAASVLDGIASFITGGSSISDFSSQLVPFGEAMTKFSSTVSGKIDEGAVAAAANAGKIMAEMASTLPNSGGVVGWFMGENDMKDFASQLVPFGEAMVEFSSVVAGKIDESAVTSAANAGKTMAEMAKTLPNSGGVVGWFMGENDMKDFAAQLVPFGEAMVEFSSTVAGKIDEDAVTAAANAGKMMAEMASTLPNSGGVVGFFAGENDIETFAAQLVPFGEAITAFSNEVKDIDEDAVTAAANAGKAMSEMANTIPNSGGLVEFFTGSNDMTGFGEQLASFGSAMASFGDKVKDIDPEAVKSASEAAKNIADLTKTEDFVSYFTDKDFSTLGTNLSSFGSAIVSFSSSVGGLDAASVESAAKAGILVAEMAKELPKSNSDSLSSKIFGSSTDLSTFATQLTTFGSGIKGFANSVSGIENIDTLKQAVSAGKAVLRLGQELSTESGTSSLASSDLGSYGTEVGIFSHGLKKYADNVADMDTEQVTSATKAAKSVLKMISSIPSGEKSVGNASSFGSQLEDFGKSLSKFSSTIGDMNADSLSTKVSAFKKVISTLSSISKDAVTDIPGNFKDMGSKVVKSINDMLRLSVDAIKNKKEAFSAAGKNMMEAFLKAILSVKPKLSKGLSEVVTSSVADVASTSMYLKFYNAGGYLVEGFAAGIDGSTYKAKAKARAMATAAKKAAEEALGIESPSKVFYKIGSFTGEGFINALSDYESRSYDAGTGIADSARKGLSNAISRIKDAVEGKIDAQPTIRPVLDLSNVNAGVGALSGMFDMNPSVGVLSNARAINSMMSKNQNGTNSEFVSAIKDLKSAMSTRSGDTYNINGVTYDDGSNITEAIKTIVRYATVERRT